MPSKSMQVKSSHSNPRGLNAIQFRFFNTLKPEHVNSFRFKIRFQPARENRRNYVPGNDQKRFERNRGLVKQCKGLEFWNSTFLELTRAPEV